MSRIQARVIIALLAVIALVGGVIAFALLKEEPANTEDSAPPVTTSATTTSSETIASSTPEEDPVAILAEAEVNSIHPAPAPEAPTSWGTYELARSWDGRVRVFEASGPQEISGENGSGFPATMNNCGMAMHYVTFRSINPNVDISAHLLNALGESATSSPVNQGWMLGTNCETPAFEFLQTSDESTLGDVVYTVHQYRESSTAPAGSLPTQPSVAAATPSTQNIPTTAAAPQPTFVQCMGYLGPPMALYSDGSERHEPSCENSPEVERAIKGESVCGGLYGWMEVGEAEYIDLCGVAPPTDRVPPTDVPSQGW